MKKIFLEPFQYEGHSRIAIRFNYDKSIIEKIRLIPGRRWSDADKCWHIEYTEEKLNALKYYLSSEGILIDDGNIDRKAIQSSSRKLKNPVSTKLTSHHQNGLDRFHIWLKNQRYSDRTCETYLGFMKTFLIFFSDKAIGEITIEDVVRFNYEVIIRKQYSISYQRQMVSAIKLFYQQIEHRKLDIDQLERPRREKKLPSIFSKEEVGSIIKSIRNEKHRVIISLIYSGGLRISELLSLVLTDIDSKRMVIHIRSGKGRKDRIVPLSGKVVKSLRAYYKRYKPRVYLFEGAPGKQYSASSCRKILKTAMACAGIRKPGSLHTLRQSYATHLLESGTDIRYIQSLLGHESSRTTEIYTHVSRKRIEDIKSPFDDLDL